jgi:hypothetical protein
LTNLHSISDVLYFSGGVMTNKARLTVDMNPDEHIYLKMACAKLGVTMREFMILATFEKWKKSKTTG